jgi:hypothetical protein
VLRHIDESARDLGDERHEAEEDENHQVVYRVLAYIVLWDNGAFATKVSKWREALDNEVRSRSAPQPGGESSRQT